MTPPELHPGLSALAPLLGTWTGAGEGEYPTIPSFGYLEEVTFGHVGKPFLAYGQKTRATDDGRPLHAETGYLRAPSPGRVELVLAHPTGITEIGEGSLTVTDGVVELELTATTIGLTASAKDVTALGRSFRIDGDELTYTLRLGAVGQPLQHHLAATLHRKTDMTPDGRIRVPADLEAVTSIGDEDHSGVDASAIDRIWRATRHWYSAGMHPAIQVCVRHRGNVVLDRAIGHGWGNGPDDPPDAEKIPVTTETPFCVYSAAKAMTTTVVHMLAERGVLLPRRPRLRVPAELHQPPQGPHDDPARDDPQRGRALRDRAQARPQADERQRVRPRDARQPADRSTRRGSCTSTTR